MVFAGRGWGQVNYPIRPAGRERMVPEAPAGKMRVQELPRSMDLNKLLPVSGQPAPLSSFLSIWADRGLRGPVLPVQGLSDDYYTRHFGFMCKKELEFEKTTRIPLKFRLGSLEYCNSLEGKR